MMDDKALPELIVVVCVIRIHRQEREGGDQLQALAHHIVDADIVGVVIIGVQRQHTARQRVHHIAAGRFENDVTHEVGGKRAVVCKRLAKTLQFVFVREFAAQKQIGDLFKTGMRIVHESIHDLLYVDAAVEQLAVAGDEFTVHFFVGLDFRDLRQSGQHAASL